MANWLKIWIAQQTLGHVWKSDYFSPFSKHAIDPQVINVSSCRRYLLSKFWKIVSGDSQGKNLENNLGDVEEFG